MNAQFRILNSQNIEAALSLNEDKVYRAGSNINFDIFLDLPEKDLYFEFSIINNMVQFLQNLPDLININVTNNIKNVVDINHSYDIPCIFNFHGINFVICDSADAWDHWNEILNNNINKKDILVHTDAIMSDAEKEQLDDILPDTSEILLKKNLLKNFIISSKFFIIIFVIILFIIIFFTINRYYKQKFLHTQHSSATDMQAIKQIEINLPSRFNNLKYLSNQKDMVVITGVVKDQTDIKFIQNKFSKYKNLVVFKIITSAEALNKINSILHTQKILFVQPEFNVNNYRIALKGLLQNLDSTNDIEIAVSNQIPEITDLDMTQIFSIKDVDKDIDNLISQNTLNSRLNIKKNLVDRIISIDGYLSKNEINDLSARISILEAKYLNLITIKLNLKDALASLPFKIVSVTTGAFPSFMTDTGQRIFEGGETDGMKVDKITQSEIYFSGKFQLVIKLDAIGG